MVLRTFLHIQSINYFIYQKFDKSLHFSSKGLLYNENITYRNIPYIHTFFLVYEFFLYNNLLLTITKWPRDVVADTPTRGNIHLLTRQTFYAWTC